MIQPVILSGGSGTRLWPLSREHYPKQLLALTGDETLLQQTALRLQGLSAIAGVQVRPPIVVCNEQHRFLVAEQLRQVEIEARAILLEPFGRNTAPALTLASLHSQQDGSDDLLLVMPADHIIQDTQHFLEAVQKGRLLAEQRALVTFGIVPNRPETGYGYIRIGEAIGDAATNTPHTVAEFVEKPDMQTAERYLASGDYLWNSGIFMMQASVWLESLERRRPEILKVCVDAVHQGQQDMDFFRVSSKAFAACPSDSIDYAVMEKTANECMSSVSENQPFGAVVPLNAGWSDVGAWSALWEVAAQDNNGNVLRGDVIAHQTTNSFVHAEDRLVASVGVHNLIIVETADAVLVADKTKSQDVKQIVEALKKSGREERITHRQVYRPWGSYEGVVEGERFQVKRIVVKPGASLSLQMHHHRAEHWIVVRGTARVTRGDEKFLLSENESTYIPLGTVHRLENPGTLPLEIIEVQSGSYLGEDDIVRYDDVYGRGGKT